MSRTQPVPVRVADASLPPEDGGSVARTGGRVILDGGGRPEVALVASGPGVTLALAAANLLLADGVAVRVVSVPSRERLPASGSADILLPQGVPRVVIGPSPPDCRRPLAGPAGEVIGLHGSGAATAGPVVMPQPGFTPEAVRAVAHDVILAAAHGPW